MAALCRSLLAILAVLALLGGAGWTGAALAYPTQPLVAQPAHDDGCGKSAPAPKCDIPLCGPVCLGVNPAAAAIAPPAPFAAALAGADRDPLIGQSLAPDPPPPRPSA